MTHRTTGPPLGAGLLAAAALAVSAPAAGAVQAPFRAVADVPLPATAPPAALAFADLDADGRRDLLVADFAGGRLLVRLGKGDGTFSATADYGSYVRARSLAVADFNGDGKEDVAIGCAPSDKDSVAVLFGTGDGHFNAGPTIGFDGGGPATSLATGDFDDDGRADIAAVTGRTLSVRVGTAQGGFDPGRDLVLPAGSYPGRVAVADFDGDAHDDVALSVYATNGAHEVRVLHGLGTGDLGTATALSPPGYLDQPLAGDVDEDGRLDLLGAMASRDSIAVRLGRGADGFDAGVPDVPVSRLPDWAVLADVDRDGHDDVVSLDVGSDAVSVRLGRGDGRFSDGGSLAVPHDAQLLATADVDGDGTQDLAFAHGPAVGVRLGTAKAPAGNLLVNGSFEAGEPARTPAEAPPLRGWQRTGGMTARRYGSWPLYVVPTWDAAAQAAGGHSFLSGGQSGPGGRTTASQDVDVSRLATAIDAGRVTADLSALLGGGRAFPDAMSARLELGERRLELGPVTPGQRHNRTTMLRRSGSATVPAGVRRLRVVLTSVDTDAISSATADDVRLTLSVRGADGKPAPAPGRRDRTAPRVTHVRVARGRRVRFTLSERARVLVRVRHGGKVVRTLRRTGRRGANHARLRHLRHGRYRLTIRATDAAGNRRTTRPRRFRRR